MRRCSLQQKGATGAVLLHPARPARPLPSPAPLTCCRASRAARPSWLRVTGHPWHAPHPNLPLLLLLGTVGAGVAPAAAATMCCLLLVGRLPLASPGPSPGGHQSHPVRTFRVWASCAVGVSPVEQRTGSHAQDTSVQLAAIRSISALDAAIVVGVQQGSQTRGDNICSRSSCLTPSYQISITCYTPPQHPSPFSPPHLPHTVPAAAARPAPAATPPPPPPAAPPSLQHTWQHRRLPSQTQDGRPPWRLQ